MSKTQKEKSGKNGEGEELNAKTQESGSCKNEKADSCGEKVSEAKPEKDENAANSSGGGEKGACESEKADDSAKIAELEEKCRDWQDQYLRKAADFDNYRKRMLKEKQEAIDYANSNLLLDLVQILDDFDRAIEAGTSQTADKAHSAFAEGILMIKNQMLSMLNSKYGLEYYPSKGVPFDPNIHEAVSMLPSDEVKEPTVGEEVMKGYKLRERIIRHAKVMVFMPKEEKTADSSSNGKSDDSSSEEKATDSSTAKNGTDNKDTKTANA